MAQFAVLFAIAIGALSSASAQIWRQGAPGGLPSFTSAQQQSGRQYPGPNAAGQRRGPPPLRQVSTSDFSAARGGRPMAPDSAQAWLNDANRRYEQAKRVKTLAEWNWVTNSTPASRFIEETMSKSLSHTLRLIYNEQRRVGLDEPEAGCPLCSAFQRRQMTYFSNIEELALDGSNFSDFMEIQGAMTHTFMFAQVPDPHIRTENITSQGELFRLMHSANDYDVLLSLWTDWRDATGAKMKKEFTEYVRYLNAAARLNGFEDAAEMWLAPYTNDVPNFENQLEGAWVKIKPLYEQLHAYVRRRLIKEYGHDKFPESGHIPAHLLGNMWAQFWDSTVLNDLGTENKGEERWFADEKFNLTEVMLRNPRFNSPRKLFERASEFYKDIGLTNMTSQFWNLSRFEFVPGMPQSCQPAAYDFFSIDERTGEGDFRVKQCAGVSPMDFQTAHHETAHIQYFQAYSRLPAVLREGANPAFREAFGEAMTISVMTETHLKNIGLLAADFPKPEPDHMALLRSALSKVSFLPFGYLIDKYRWAIFRGEIPPRDYNMHWWRLRCELQGISPPIEDGPTRSEAFFDAGAKFHVAANIPYIRYFVSNLLQFQIHRHLCRLAYADVPEPLRPPLHECDISRKSALATNLKNYLAEALAAGRGAPWPEVLRKMAGGNGRLDASAMLEFYRPLMVFLEKANKGSGEVGWDKKCSGRPMSTVAWKKTSNASSFLTPPFLNTIITCYALLLVGWMLVRE